MLERLLHRVMAEKDFFLSLHSSANDSINVFFSFKDGAIYLDYAMGRRKWRLPIAGEPLPLKILDLLAKTGNLQAEEWIGREIGFLERLCEEANPEVIAECNREIEIARAQSDKDGLEFYMWEEDKSRLINMPDVLNRGVFLAVCIILRRNFWRDKKDLKMIYHRYLAWSAIETASESYEANLLKNAVTLENKGRTELAQKIRQLAGFYHQLSNTAMYQQQKLERLTDFKEDYYSMYFVKGDKSRDKTRAMLLEVVRRFNYKNGFMIASVS